LISDYAYLLVSLGRDIVLPVIHIVGQLDRAVEFRKFGEEYGKSHKNAWGIVHFTHFWYHFQLGEALKYPFFFNIQVEIFSVEDAFLLMENTKTSDHSYMGQLLYASTVLQHAETELGKEEMTKFLENAAARACTNDDGFCVNKSNLFQENSY
jgi:hypothetical protein